MPPADPAADPPRAAAPGLGALWIAVAAFNGFFAVALDAIVYHSRQQSLTPEQLDILGFAVEYQELHALALIGVALLARGTAGWPLSALRLAAWLFALGLALFCGGIYAQNLLGIGPLGPIVPAGGAALVLGWAALGFYAVLAWQRE